MRNKGTFFSVGAGYAADLSEVVGIFDLDKTTDGKITREFLTKAEKNGQVISAGQELPKSFLVTADGDKSRVIVAQPASATLRKRYEQAAEQQKKRNAERRKNG